MATMLRGLGRALLRRPRPCWGAARGRENVAAAPCISAMQERRNSNTTVAEGTEAGGVEGEDIYVPPSKSPEQLKEEATKLWQATQLADALSVLRTRRRQGEHFSLRKAVLHLKYYAEHLTNRDLVMLLLESLRLSMLNVSKGVVELLCRDENVSTLARHIDEVVMACVKAKRSDLAMAALDAVHEYTRHVEDEEEGEGEGKEQTETPQADAAPAAPGALPLVASAQSYKALFGLLCEGRRFVQGADFVGRHRLPACDAAAEGDKGFDVHVIALGMRVAWRASKWPIANRMLETLPAYDALPSPPPGPPLRRALFLLEALIAHLGPIRCLDADHCNMLLGTQIALGNVDKAIAYLHHMRQRQEQTASDGSTWRLPSPSAQSLTLLLDALSRKGEWQRCLDLLASTRDVITDPAQLAHVYKTAIASLGRVGLWEGALSLFYEMHERALPIDTHTYTAVAKALKDGRQWASAHKFLEVMREQDASPSRYTYNVVLSALGRAREVDKAIELFRSMEHKGMAPTVYDYGTILSVCGKSGRVDDALALLKEARQRKEQDEADLEKAAAGEETAGETAEGESEEEGEGKEGEGKRRVPANVGMMLDNCYLQTIKAAGKAGRWQDALAVFEEREEMAVEQGEGLVSFALYTELLRALAHAGQAQKALHILRDYEHKLQGGKVQIMCYNAVLEACHKAGQWEDALALLTHMRTTGPRPGNAAYSAAMRACLRAQVPEKAMGLLQAMREQEEGQACYGSDGVSSRQDNRPDLATHGLYMRVCASAGHWEDVLTTLQHMRTHGPSPDALCVVHAISALVSCGRVKEAVKVLEESERGVQGAERPRLLAFHVALLGAIDAQDWDSFDAAAAQLQRVEGLLPTPEVTHALLSAGRERGGQGTGEALEPLRQSIAQAAALNPHHPLRRAKVEVLGASFN